MDCESATELIGVRLGGDIRGEDRTALEAHLASCDGCRATLEDETSVDKLLRGAFAGRREAAGAVAERTVARLRIECGGEERSGCEKGFSHEQVAGKDSRDVGCEKGFSHQQDVGCENGFSHQQTGFSHQQGHRARLTWLRWPAAIAAGFLLAVMVFRPWQAAVHELAKPVARLALATGPIEAMPVGRSTWEALSTGAPIAEGSRVRTGAGVCCEVQTTDGALVRLNAATEVQFRGGRAIELARGQIYASVARAAGTFEVLAPGTTVTALGTQFDVRARPGETVLTVAEGSTRAKSAGAELVVNARETLRIVNGVAAKPERADDVVVATRWIHELLVLKGRENAELAWRIDEMLGQIGRTKASYLAEQEIRSLGDRCALPLARYVQRCRSPQEHAERVRAARILADVAQPWCIPELVRLLGDADHDVCRYAVEALTRLTGLPRCAEPEQWRDEPLASCETCHEKWNGWWEENRERYPRPL